MCSACWAGGSTSTKWISTTVNDTSVLLSRTSNCYWINNDIGTVTERYYYQAGNCTGSYNTNEYTLKLRLTIDGSGNLTVAMGINDWGYFFLGTEHREIPFSCFDIPITFENLNTVCNFSTDPRRILAINGQIEIWT
jgi:hypothetical protein